MAGLASQPEPDPTPQPAPGQSQPVHIHFPGRFLATRTHGDDSSRSSSISFTGPAQSMLQPSADGRAAMSLNEARRRVRSLGSDPVASGSKATKTSPQYSSRRKKDPTPSQSSALSPLKFAALMSDFEPSAFSDEYDLYPKILQDVQRALHLQSRRRERMSQQLHPASDQVPSDMPVNTSIAYTTTSTVSSAQHSSPKHLQVVSLPSEIDFSPSTRSAPLHPVPLSSNSGATLDWTGSHSSDEKLDRRWTISRGKRKTKEQMQPSGRGIVEKQETLFIDRISRIKAEASSPTVRKAAIVSEQLGRRYNLLYASLANGNPVGLTQIARWHAGLGAETQAWFESAEPLTWMKHLLVRRGKQRSQWHLSALIMEEYIKFKKGIPSPAPPAQSSIASSSLETPYSQNSLSASAKHISAPASDSSPGASVSRVRSSDGRISFGPFVVGSPDVGNSPTHEGNNQGWRNSLPAFFDSSSATGAQPQYHSRNSARMSPESSRLSFPDIIHRFRRHRVESEEGSSSPFGSQSEDQSDYIPSGFRTKSKRDDPFYLGELQSPQESTLEINTSSGIPNVNDITSVPADSTAGPVFPVPFEQDTHIPPEEVHPETILAQSMSLHRTRSYRSTSLPLMHNVQEVLSISKTEDEEDLLERKYELKLRTLEELKNHNHRLRHRMQRAAVDVREYELVCSGVMPALGIAYRSLPMELLDAFSHDPSAVTSGTRRRHGWRVVEDIHARVFRQRNILASFLSRFKTDASAVSVPDNVLDKPISTLIEKLQALERERGPLQEQADEVSRMLAEVRTCHSVVKEEYNDALSYTSVVYPELSHIIALEESYKAHYQQVWELGMDALTLILDTITPFWRSYGKIIGEDMQDFIIIPWYRNEFTGESKRYPVRSVPRRSFRHWVALFCLCLVTFFVTFLQARAAITSALHYRLICIDNQAFRWTIMPFFWVVILIQWFALMFEICVVLLHVAVVVWWLGWFVGICT